MTAWQTGYQLFGDTGQLHGTGVVTMIPTLIATVLIVAAFCAYVARVQIALKAPLPDPAGDWWPQFERQFRAHAIRVARQKRRRSPL